MMPPAVRDHRQLLRNERGQALVLVALASVMLIGAMGFAIDVAHVLSVRRMLQASTDAAATAGAQDIGVSNGNPSAKATLFSSVTGNKNAISGLSGVTISTSLKCTDFMANLMTGDDCTPSTPNNTIVVTQQVTIPTFFAKLVGTSGFTVRTTATAGGKGGGMPPLDVIIVLDTTGSMGSNCSATVSGISHPSRLDCAKAGVRMLLNLFWPCSRDLVSCGTVTSGNVSNPIDRVGMFVFPGLKSTVPVSRNYDCSNNLDSDDVAPYNASPVYSMVPLSSDYKSSATGGLQGGSSNMVKSVDWANGAGCSSNNYGLENPAGQGSYFTDALNAAQASLMANGRSGVQKVIIFVSDGDANEYANNTPTNPCQSAVSAADTIAATGTWIYAVAYGASTSSSTCADDSGAGKLTSKATMQGIASDSGKFFDQPTSGDLTATFRQIGQSLLTTRLLDDATN
jgi:Flp pilus assembly protein TadG